jgi:hypothetical protein
MNVSTAPVTKDDEIDDAKPRMAGATDTDH